MTKKQHYMTRDERLQLEALSRAKVPVTQIARQLGFSRQTIYNELRRGAVALVRIINGMDRDVVEYSADKAQQLHKYNQTAKGRPLKIGNDHKYAEFLEDKILNEHYSPAAALAAAREEGHQTSVCISTLYSYIDKQIFMHLTNKNLWIKSQKKKREYNTIKRIAHTKLPSIEIRPDYVSSRQEYGHWEMDLIIGKAETKPVLLTMTERLSREELIFKLPDRKAATIRAVFDKLEKSTPQFREKFKSITTDNGPEFLEYDLLTRSIRDGRKRFEVYYCHSYSAWEKGSVENHNRMIRRFFPKGTDFSRVTKKQVAEIQNWMNSYPRRILGWKTPKWMSKTLAA